MQAIYCSLPIDPCEFMSVKKSHKTAVKNKFDDIYDDKLVRLKSATWEFIRQIDNKSLSMDMTDEEYAHVNLALDKMVDKVDEATFIIEYLLAHWDAIKTGKFKV